jgi:hypothetical protein
MAVIQISKIQQRRGQRLQTGIPQLSSGELAWAVDTQELFIGNGSLAEGAPYVGNTKLLTEHDNILELANSYRFANDDASITFSISRSLQSKIDEIEVSVLDFGTGELVDGSTNCAEAFHKAFSELFQNTNEKYKKVLKVPNGRYLFTEPLLIPSNVILRGETRDGVILDITIGGIFFTSENNTTEIDFTGSDRPKNILISNLTIYSSSQETDITGLKSSLFDNVRFLSDYEIGDDVLDPETPYVEYDISGIGTGGSLEIVISSLLTEGPPLSVAVAFEENTVNTINNLVSSLNLTTSFNPFFFARNQSEYLIIEPISPNPENYTASNISSFFTVIITNLTESGPIITTLTTNFNGGINLIESTSGIEKVKSLVSWKNSIFDTRVEDISFKNCLFEKSGLSIKCLNRLIGTEEKFKTSLIFENCKFRSSDTGIFIESPVGQINDWSFLDCKFEEIFRNAIYSINGTGITVSRATIKNCGNGINDAANPEYPIFLFEGVKFGNVVVNSISDRHQFAGIVSNPDVFSVPESVNSGVTSFINDYYADIEPSDAFTTVAVFSSLSRYVEIDYMLVIEGRTRKGMLVLVVDDQMTEIAISDNYTYSSETSTGTGGLIMTEFEFRAILEDNNSDSGKDTIILQYKNPDTNRYGSLSYTLTYGV